MSNFCSFQSIKIWSQRRKPFSNKTPQNKSIRSQITFGIQLQTFPSKCNSRKRQFKTWNTAEKNLFQQRRQLYPPIRRANGSCNQFPSFMSEPHLSTRSRHVSISKSSRFYLIFSGQKHIPGKHRATNEQVH